MLNTSFESGQTLPTDRQMASPPKQVFQTLKVDSGDNTIGAQLLQLDLGAQSFCIDGGIETRYALITLGLA